jgi:ABC-type dipeptide/oligopeptide/nickel transport system permease subunit
MSEPGRPHNVSEGAQPGFAATAASATAPVLPEPGTQPPKRTEREFTVRERSQWIQALNRFRRHRLAFGSLILFLVIVLIAFVGARLWKYPQADTSSPGSLSPGLDHPFGTDEIGHDMVAEVLRGAQQSIKVALLVALLSSGIGVPYGALAGYYGGRIDTIMMRVADVLLTLPLFALAGALSRVFDGSWWSVSLILGGLGWVVNARVVRGVVLSVREQEFIEAARALGSSDLRIVFRHLIPNVTSAIIVQATLDIAIAILNEAALSFVGLGVRAPDTSLGLLTNAARDKVDTKPWLFYAPGLTIILIALTANFIGDGLRDALDPRQTRIRR